MRLLYYTWGENSRRDGAETLQRLGHEVCIASEAFASYDADEQFERKIQELIVTYRCEAVFTFDYFPLLSSLCERMSLPYYAWIYDSPHMTLYSKTIFHKCNHIGVFDRVQYEELKREGADTVSYLPLGVNVIRLNELLREDRECVYGVSFVGRLYDDATNHYDRIRYMPDRLRGYIDGMMQAQMRIYGYDFINELFDMKKAQELAQYASFDLGSTYMDRTQKILADMIRMKITSMERRELLTAAAQAFGLDLFAPQKPDGVDGVRFHGTIDYETVMPRVFRTSRINLNITLRSIQSGIPLRVLDIMGAGGFVLTNYQPEIAEYFENGRDLVWFDSKEDMLYKIAYYLEHEEERYEIACNGFNKVKTLFSMDAQMRKLFDA